MLLFYLELLEIIKNVPSDWEFSSFILINIQLESKMYADLVIWFYFIMLLTVPFTAVLSVIKLNETTDTPM